MKVNNEPIFPINGEADNKLSTVVPGAVESKRFYGRSRSEYRAEHYYFSTCTAGVTEYLTDYRFSWQSRGARYAYNGCTMLDTIKNRCERKGEGTKLPVRPYRAVKLYCHLFCRRQNSCNRVYAAD